ncbi:MAG TPA: hypothetical protein VK612_01600 [Pyrinomonadaceae bacterium]|nr:hypothetical protein [Pyrinomonadaceae bacterium]
MIKKHMSMSGDSMGGGSNNKTVTTMSKNSSSPTTYKNLRIGRPVGKPSVSQAKIVAAVRAVMKEDGMI